MKHSLMEQLKAQLQHERNIAGDDEINAMPDSGNVDAFARKLVSAADPVNMSLKAKDRFGSESDGVVSVFSEDEDEFSGNENNRRVAERVKREAEMLAGIAQETKQRQRTAQTKPADPATDGVIGGDTKPGASGEATGDPKPATPRQAAARQAAAGAWKPQG